MMSISEVIIQFFIGWLIADFLSGFFHWLEDRVLWIGMPLISKAVVEPNRLHHDQPSAFLDSSFLSRNSTTWMVVIPLSLLWFIVSGFTIVWLAASLGGMVVAEVHALAHRQQTGFLRPLQETGIIQSPAHHSRHHRSDHDSRYCMLTGYLNPWCDWIGIWSGLERLLTKVGLEPNRGMK